MNGTSDRWFLFFLLPMALRGKRKKLHVGNFKMQFFSSGVMEQCIIIRIFIVAIPTVMFTPRAHVFPWQRIDKPLHTANNAAGKQGEISTSTFHSSMVSICAVLCWLVSPGTDPHALDRNKSRSEVPILKSCQAAGRPSVNTRFCQKSVT